MSQIINNSIENFVEINETKTAFSKYNHNIDFHSKKDSSKWNQIIEKNDTFFGAAVH